MPKATQTDKLKEYTETLLEDIRNDFAEKKMPVIRTLQRYKTTDAIIGMADGIGTRLYILGYPYCLDAGRYSRCLDAGNVMDVLNLAKGSLDEDAILLIDSFGLVSQDAQEEILSMLTAKPSNLDVVIVLTARNHVLPSRTQEILDDASKFRIHDYTV